MYQKLLAPLDGSKLAECSLEHVKEIAAGCSISEVVLLTVVEKLPPAYFEIANQRQIGDNYKSLERRQQVLGEMAEKYLAQVSENLIKQGISAQRALVQAEANQSIPEAILNYAESNKIDLIVMSTHGYSGFTRWAFGSVTERIVRHSNVPVLIVSPPGCRQ
jgi:nucleotide-binding universal stress UspA family protein